MIGGSWRRTSGRPSRISSSLRASSPSINSRGSCSNLTSCPESISLLEPYCAEFLIHAADVEGLQRGIDHELVSKLAEWCSIPVTYAGGARYIDDLPLVKKLSNGKVDLTIGSALDIFGGEGCNFEECARWNEEQ